MNNEKFDFNVVVLAFTGGMIVMLVISLFCLVPMLMKVLGG